MKKFSCVFLALIGFGLTSMVFAEETKATAEESVLVLKYQNNKEYITLQNSVARAPDVVEFFSFYCPHCYDFETKYKIPGKIQDNLPDNKKMTKYHVDFMGGLSSELSEAWAVAVVLGVDDKVGPKIFDGIHQKRNLKSTNDIVKIFEEVGISKADFESAKQSTSVQIWKEKQAKAIEQFEVNSVPTFYVNGKYLVNSGGLNMSKPFDEQFSDIVNFLLVKDNNK
ncbi:DsbA family protein [Thorsellia kenyensis]|uniref:Thiol:disulfide interchange protein n=1 Tax=Thorsellia kenyensis TaxID=1549888 RepID=A0ABV6C8U9_9GAMM